MTADRSPREVLALYRAAEIQQSAAAKKLREQADYARSFSQQIKSDSNFFLLIAGAVIVSLLIATYLAGAA